MSGGIPQKGNKLLTEGGFLRALRLVEMTLLGLITAHIIVGACIASLRTVISYYADFIQENIISYPRVTVANAAVFL